MRSKRLELGLLITLIAAASCGGGTRKAVQPSEVETTGGSSPAAPAAPPTMNELPAGTPLTVRVVDPLSSESVSQGSKFAAVTAAPIATESGEVVVPDGTKLFGHVSEARSGGPVRSPRLVITIDQLQIDERMIQIATTGVGAEGGHGGAAKKVGAGALIGAATGSAAGGAAVGGAAALLSRGNEIVIKPGTLIEVRLTKPAKIR